MTEDMKIIPKFTVSGRIKTHCTGCGQDRFIEHLLEPVAFENAELMVRHFKIIIQTLVNAPCPECNKKTKQTDWFGAV